MTDWGAYITAAAALSTAIGGVYLGGRANRNQTLASRSATNLAWVQQARAEAAAATTNAMEAESRAGMAQLRAERAERRLYEVEERMADAERSISDLMAWVERVVHAARDQTVGEQALRDIINGGPPPWAIRPSRT